MGITEQEFKDEKKVIADVAEVISETLVTDKFTFDEMTEKIWEIMDNAEKNDVFSRKI